MKTNIDGNKIISGTLWEVSDISTPLLFVLDCYIYILEYPWSIKRTPIRYYRDFIPNLTAKQCCWLPLFLYLQKFIIEVWMDKRIGRMIPTLVSADSNLYRAISKRNWSISCSTFYTNGTEFHLEQFTLLLLGREDSSY